MADTKNYGLKGVGDDVQFGKAGGRFVFNTGASDFRATTDGTTLSHLQVLTPVGNTDAATKLYVDDVAAGLDPKESCEAASTADIGATYNSTGGSGTGSFSSVPATIDGVTLAQDDRVLLKNQTNADENGIYVVLATTTTMNRASDSNTDAKVTAGNYTFITEGTANADSGWTLQGPDPLTVGTGSGSDLNWVLFSTSSAIVAGVGLVKNGNVLDFNIAELTSAATIATSDELVFDDSTVESRITVANFLADRDIVTATANGVLVRTANDTYASRTITASAVAGDEGISIVNGNGVSGNPTIGIDIIGQTQLATVETGDELLISDLNASNANKSVTVDALKTFMNAGTSSTSITEGDTTLAVSDSGSDGTLTYTADATQVFNVTDTTFTFENGLDLDLPTSSTITVADLTENDVMIVGASGLLEDSGGNLTFSGSVLALTGDQTISQSLYLIEQASAGADTATQGQLWTRTNTPNTSMFTGDTGIDFVTANVHETNYQYAVEVADADPGAGLLRFDSVTIGSITEMYIDDTDNVAKDYGWALSNLGVGDILTIRSMADPADYIVASVTSALTDNTGYWTVPLTLIHTGTIFTDDDQLVITIEWQSQGVSAVPTLITVADSSDSTSFVSFFESATGDLGPKTDSQLTYNATSGALTAVSFAGNLTLDGTTFTTVDTAGEFTDDDVTIMTAAAVNDRIESFGYSTTVGTITGTVADNQVAIGTGASSLDSSANLTFDGTTVTVAGVLIVDEITIDGDVITNNTTNQPLILRPNGTGSIIFQNGSSEEILELNDTASAINGLAITAGATGNPGQITTGTGSEANIDIGFLTNGTGAVSVVAGSGNYEDNVTADDDIPNKKYVDDAIALTGGSGTLDSVTGTVDMATVGVQNIGAATGIPANCTILSVTMEVDDISDTATTVTVGDATNGAAAYMATTENDPEVLDIYIADGRVLNGAGARQAIATVANDSTASASAEIIITFRHA